MPSGFPGNRPRPIRNARGQFTSNNFSFYWQGLEDLGDRLIGFGDSISEARRSAIDAAAGDLEEYMKENAPWSDVTGDARRGLKGVAVHDADSSTLVGAHTVPYGPALEMEQAGRRAIIEPSLIVFAARIGGYLKRAVSSGGFQP